MTATIPSGRFGTLDMSSNKVNSFRENPKSDGGTRLLFAGDLTNTDLVMNNSFWVGVYPELNGEMLSFIEGKIEAFFGVNF